MRARGRALTSLVSRNGAVAVLVVVVVAGALLVPTFGSADDLRNLALSASFIAIIAAGMTFVIVSGGIDLSVGSTLALAVILSASWARHGSWVAVFGSLAVAAFVGRVQELIIAFAELPPFIVTLAGLTGIRGIAGRVRGRVVAAQQDALRPVGAGDRGQPPGRGTDGAAGPPPRSAVSSPGCARGWPGSSRPRCPGAARRRGSATRSNCGRSRRSSSAARCSPAVSGRSPARSPGRRCSSSSRTSSSRARTSDSCVQQVVSGFLLLAVVLFQATLSRRAGGTEAD